MRCFSPFEGPWQIPTLAFMSDNYKAYAEKMADLRAWRAQNRPLRGQVEELFAVVRQCEARWQLEDRIEGRPRPRA